MDDIKHETVPAGDAERTEQAIGEVRDLVEHYRTTCFWFMHEKWLPESVDAARRAVILLQRYGDREAYLLATALKPWLSRPSSRISAG
jgi:hypothetical protein